MGHDLGCDQLEMVEVVEVDHLQVGALRADGGELAQPLGHLLGTARSGVLPEVLQI